MRRSAVPGTIWIRRSSLSANRRLSSTSYPVTWMSIGEGRPKFRIWLTMSAGRNEKSTPGNCSRQLQAQIMDILFRRSMVRVQADQNVGVRRSGGGGIAVGEVDAAVGQADVVDDAGDFARWNLLTYEALDPVAEARGLFDSRAGPRPQMQFELSGVDARKEIPAQPGNQKHERAHAHHCKAPQKRGAVMQAALQHLRDNGHEISRTPARRQPASV